MDLLVVHLRIAMGSLGIRDENLGKFWSRSWDGAKMWMASLLYLEQWSAGRTSVPTLWALDGAITPTCHTPLLTQQGSLIFGHIL